MTPRRARSAPPPHPRPQLQRAAWTSLDGTWEFALDRHGEWRCPADVAWEARIRVPFAPETPASGIAAEGFFAACWYRRAVDAPPRAHDERLLLHFGAVDYRATVWIDGVRVGAHEGGYTPFTFDVSEALRPGSGQHALVVRAEDDPLDLAKPRGKQDWLPEPHSIWYPRTSGIWQTVWLEPVPATYLRRLRWTPNLERWEIHLNAAVDGVPRNDLRVRVRLAAHGRLLADDRYPVLAAEVSRGITFADPGIDDYRNELLWRPESPTLIDAALELQDADGRLVDAVTSYTALRTVRTEGNRFILNGRPLQLRMVLDQGYWPDTGLTPPDDAALRRDVELVKTMGFNGARKHQKIEQERWLYWADRLGLLVWEEMPSAYRFTRDSVRRITTQWMEAIERDYSHPCIVAWVPFNESWGVPNLPEVPAERHFVQALYHLTRTLDVTRPVIGNDGWESVATDIIGIHDYAADPAVLTKRYGIEEEMLHRLRRERPGGRLLLLGEPAQGSQPLVLSEFGGIAYAPRRNGTWGYSRAASPAEFRRRYTRLMDAVRELPALAGFCYTQFTDTYQETNGLLFADRRPKIPLAAIARATRGSRTRHEVEIETEWHARLLGFDDHADAPPKR